MEKTLLTECEEQGRLPSKAPIGYINTTTPDGKKIIVPKQPEANHIKWSFNQMAYLNGFICKRNNFWRLIHNPVYCGFVTLSATKDEDMQLIKGIHEPLISEELFKNVQAMILSKRREGRKKESLKSIFPLRGFLTCPYCNRRLSGSISQGRYAKYHYYHCCKAKCRGRFKAEVLEATYEKQLKNIWISPAAVKLFTLILEDENILTVQKSLLQHRKSILNEVEKEELFLSKVRKLFIEDKIDHEDFTNLKKEQKEKLASINERLDMIGP